jgi:hypothetical protein
LSRACTACVRARVRAAAARQRAARQALDRAPAARAAQPPGRRVVPSRAPAASLRATFEQATDKQWTRLCAKAVDLAVKGDRQMLRLVLAYRLGRPPETTEDSGVEDFFSLVLGALRGDGVADDPDGPAG